MGLQSDTDIAAAFAEQLQLAKRKILLVCAPYTNELSDFLEKKFGVYEPLVASNRLKFIQMSVGHGKLFSNAAKASKVTVIAGADAIPAQELTNWLAQHCHAATQIVLTGMRSTHRFRLFESLVHVWADNVLVFKAAAAAAPIRLSSKIPEKWLREAKSQTEEVVVVCDDDSVERMCSEMGKDAATFRPGDVVNYKGRNFKIAGTFLYERVKGKTRERAFNGEVRSDYSDGKWAEVSYNARGINADKRWNLKMQRKNGLKHAGCIGISDFSERVAAVVLATRSITPELLKFASTKAEKVFYVGAIENSLEPSRKRRRFDALERLF